MRLYEFVDLATYQLSDQDLKQICECPRSASGRRIEIMQRAGEVCKLQEILRQRVNFSQGRILKTIVLALFVLLTAAQ